MSISQIFNNQVPHPWANLRVNSIMFEGATGSADTLLNYFSTDTYSIPFSGPYAQAPVTVKATRIGNMVTLSIDGRLAPSNAAGGFITSAPLFDLYRPSNEQDFICRIQNINSVTSGRLIISTAGIITITSALLGPNDTFSTGAGTVGLADNVTISYII